MSLLLTFFVLLLSFASMDERKYAAVAGSMRDAFGVQRVHSGEFEALANSIVTLSDRESTPYLEVIQTKSRFIKNEQAFAKRLKQTVRQKKLERVVEVEQTPRGVLVRVPGGVLFKPGASELEANALVFLHEIAALIEQAPGEVAVEGHTDSSPSGRSHSSNWELSAARAVSVLRHLVEVEGVDPKRMRASGLADTKPLVRDPAPEELEKNRRVEFVFLHPRSETEELQPVGQTEESEDD